MKRILAVIIIIVFVFDLSAADKVAEQIASDGQHIMDNPVKAGLVKISYGMAFRLLEYATFDQNCLGMMRSLIWKE